MKVKQRVVVKLRVFSEVNGEREKSIDSRNLWTRKCKLGWDSLLLEESLRRPQDLEVQLLQYNILYYFYKSTS